MIQNFMLKFCLSREATNGFTGRPFRACSGVGGWGGGGLRTSKSSWACSATKVENMVCRFDRYLGRYFCNLEASDRCQSLECRLQTTPGRNNITFRHMVQLSVSQDLQQPCLGLGKPTSCLGCLTDRPACLQRRWPASPKNVPKAHQKSHKIALVRLWKLLHSLGSHAAKEKEKRKKKDSSVMTRIATPIGLLVLWASPSLSLAAAQILSDISAVVQPSHTTTLTINEDCNATSFEASFPTNKVTETSSPFFGMIRVTVPTTPSYETTATSSRSSNIFNTTSTGQLPPKSHNSSTTAQGLLPPYDNITTATSAAAYSPTTSVSKSRAGTTPDDGDGSLGVIRVVTINAEGHLTTETIISAATNSTCDLVTQTEPAASESTGALSVLVTITTNKAGQTVVETERAATRKPSDGVSSSDSGNKSQGRSIPTANSIVTITDADGKTVIETFQYPTASASASTGNSVTAVETTAAAAAAATSNAREETFAGTSPPAANSIGASSSSAEGSSSSSSTNSAGNFVVTSTVTIPYTPKASSSIAGSGANPSRAGTGTGLGVVGLLVVLLF